MAWFTKCPKTIKNTFPDFLFLSGDCETVQTHHDTDSQNLEWGIHTDINSVFPDFFLTFWWISKFPDPYENFLTFSWLFKIFTFSWPAWSLRVNWWYRCVTSVQNSKVNCRSWRKCFFNEATYPGIIFSGLLIRVFTHIRRWRWWPEVKTAIDLVTVKQMMWYCRVS